MAGRRLERRHTEGHSFTFDGGAGTYLWTGIAGFLVTVLTFGICYPWAVVMRYRWRTKHTIVDGYRLRFTGDAWSLFGMWIKWWLLCLITFGVYSFWVGPRLTRWIVEHQEFGAQVVTGPPQESQASPSPAPSVPNATGSAQSTSRARGWYRDPSGRFDYRFFDGGWTDHVANDGDDNDYVDPVPRPSQRRSG